MLVSRRGEGGNGSRASCFARLILLPAPSHRGTGERAPAGSASLICCERPLYAWRRSGGLFAQSVGGGGNGFAGGGVPSGAVAAVSVGGGGAGGGSFECQPDEQWRCHHRGQPGEHIVAQSQRRRATALTVGVSVGAAGGVTVGVEAARALAGSVSATNNPVVIVDSTNLTTGAGALRGTQNNAYGIRAQSIGGDGGNGGFRERSRWAAQLAWASA